MHAGGVIADALVQKQTFQGIRAVFAPKVKSLTRLLDAACKLAHQHGFRLG